MSLLGVSDAAFMIFLVIAYQRGKPSTIALFGYSNLLYAYFADVVIFKRPVQPGQLLPTLFIAFITISLGIYKAREASQEHTHM